MPPDLLVYGHTVEAVFTRALKGRISLKLNERLKALGIDLSALQKAYPLEVFQTAVIAAGEEAFPGVSIGVALERLGELSVDAYRDTTMGKLAVAALKLMGPHQTLARAKTSLRSSNNYTEATTTKLGPTHYELFMSHVARLSEFNLGVVSAALRMSGAKNVRVRIAKREGVDCTYDIQWDA